MITYKMLIELNFPAYELRTKTDGKRKFVFDSIRKKYVVLTPEEVVRQHLINYLINEKKYPASLISVEMPLQYIQLKKRSDLLIHSRNGQALMIVECKSPDVAITEKVFDQIFIYNQSIKAPYLLVTNGLQHYCMTVSPARFLKEVPNYSDLLFNV
jgi:hypothetical protein